MLNWKKILTLGLAAGSVLFSVACASLQDESGSMNSDLQDQKFNEFMTSPVEGAVSIHTIVSGKSKNPAGELTVHGFYGEKILVEKLPWLTSLEIQDIIPVERPLKVRGIYDLKLQLSDKGREQWDAMVKNDSPDSDGYAVLIDGVFYMAFHPRRFYKASAREIVLEGPFDQVVSTKLNKNAPFNYLKLKKVAKAEKQNTPSAK